MLEENNDIVIVDDNPDDVYRLSVIFNAYGIGCRSFVYDPIELIDEPLKNVKLAFFDICLSTTGNDTAQFAILCEAIKGYISCENRDFVLVFWTSNPQMIEDFKRFVNEREGSQMPKPIAIKAIDKLDFLDKAEELQHALSDLMEDPIVKCLFSFETELKAAANKSLQDVLRYIEFPDVWGENTQYIENIKQVFAKIAIEAFGKERGKHNPDLAIKEAFAPLFTHYLCQNESSVWAELFGEQDISEIKKFPNETIAAQLNSLFHVDFSAKEIDSRGSVRKIEKDEEALVEIFKEQIGYAPDDWISSVLLNGIEIKDEFLELIALEYSAACDYSNAKERTHRYMFGVIVSEVGIKKLQKKQNHLSKAVFPLPFKFMYGGRVCTIYLHFNFSVNEEETSPNKILGERLFSLKSEVMNMICDRHANHISRIGITSFC